MFKGEEKGRFFSFQEGSKYVGMYQTGFWQPLFCENCEAILQKNEVYVARLFDNGLWENAELLRYADGRTCDQVRQLIGIDYKKFKLLFLSIFWRLSLEVCFFTQIPLGPYREKLRSHILESRVPDEDRFGLIIGRITINGEYQPDFITDHLSGKIGTTHRMYTNVLRGYAVSLIVGAPPIPIAFFPFVARENGTQIILNLEYEKMQGLHDIGHHVANTPLPGAPPKGSVQ